MQLFLFHIRMTQSVASVVLLKKEKNMNLVEKLLAADSKKIGNVKKKEISSKELSEILGEPVKVTIRTISGEEYHSLGIGMLDRKGEVDYSKTFDVNAKIVAAGLAEPDLKNEELLKHIGVATPADAAKKIFRGEINKIAGEISKLSGFVSEEETEEEVKNSSKTIEK